MAAPSRKDLPDLGIKNESIDLVVGELRKLLANELGLYLRTRTTHWMVESPQFLTYHEMFEKQYQRLDKIIDRIAERIRQLGRVPMESLKQYQKEMTVDDSVSSKSNALEMIEGLAKQHELVTKQMRESIRKMSNTEDYGTPDVLTNIIEKHEKTIWFLRSHLVNAPGTSE